MARSATSSPVVIADVWDNPGGGTAGDATVLLAELLRQRATDVAVGTIWDPIAVQICFAAGEGAEIQLRFGAKSAPDTGAPIDKRVKIVRLVKDAQMRFGESYVPFGDAALISFDGIEVIDGFHKVLKGRNGGGDPWHTDGRLFTGIIRPRVRDAPTSPP